VLLNKSFSDREDALVPAKTYQKSFAENLKRKNTKFNGK